MKRNTRVARVTEGMTSDECRRPIQDGRTHVSAVTSAFRLPRRGSGECLEVYTQLAAAFLLGVWLTGVAAGEAASPPPRIDWQPMTVVSAWGTPTVRAEIGRIRVRENRASGSTRQIELAFVRIPALKPSSRPPIVWLSGGPGDSGIGDLDTPALRLFLELRRTADVIVLDQRGTGLSMPRLDCPGVFHFPMGVVLDRERTVRGLEDAARACSERLRAQGVDIASYNARESAEDVEDLRQALGVPRVSLLAGSYGTHLALAVVRAHDDRLDRAVLIGVVGPDHLRTRPSSLDGELAAIARIAPAGRDRQKSLDLLTTIRAVRERLSTQPASVAIRGSEGDGTIALGAFELDWFAKSLLSSREAIAHLPAVFEAMASGDFRELASASILWRTSAAPSAARFTPRCAAGVSRERAVLVEQERQLTAFPNATDLTDERICRAWGIEPLPDDFRSPVKSELPMLLVSGSLDGLTPESNAAEVRRDLPHASQLLVEGGAHSLLGFGDAESRDAIVRFFEGGGRTSDRRIKLSSIEFERFENPVAVHEGRLAGMAAAAGSPLGSPFQSLIGQGAGRALPDGSIEMRRAPQSPGLGAPAAPAPGRTLR